MDVQTPTRRLLAVTAVLLTANLAVGLARTLATPASAQSREGAKVVGITMDQKYVYRAWSDGRVEACYCRWVGDQDPAQHPNKWMPADPANRP